MVVLDCSAHRISFDQGLNGTILEHSLYCRKDVDVSPVSALYCRKDVDVRHVSALMGQHCCVLLPPLSFTKDSNRFFCDIV